MATAPRVPDIPEPPQELQRLKSQFLASLNHEIRTPLSGILGMTDLLLETELTEIQREYVSTARTCAEDLLELLNAAIELSALSSGPAPLEEGEFNLVELLKSVLDHAGAKARGKALRLVGRLEPTLPLVVAGDAVRIRQVLSQLLGNAIKFTREGEVELLAAARRLGSERSLLEVRIRDTGIGMTPEQIKHLFESFRQLDTGLGRRYAGLGLGLALADKLVKLMHGEIGADSEPGKGSVFTVRIPVVLAREAAVTAPVRELQPAEAGHKRILLVEDDAVARRIVAHMLGRRRYAVESVGSGEAAIEAAEARPYCLILMDLQMPGLDGIETTQAIRRLPGYAKVPVIALTAHTTEDYRTWCRQQGLQGFLSKPVHPDDLLAAVTQHLA